MNRTELSQFEIQTWWSLTSNPFRLLAGLGRLLSFIACTFSSLLRTIILHNSNSLRNFIWLVYCIGFCLFLGIQGLGWLHCLLISEYKFIKTVVF